MKTSVKMLMPTDCPGAVYFLPTPKSPHGVDIDPTGEYIVGGGKLASVIPVHSFTKMIAAIDAKAFDGELYGIPILKYESVMVGEVQKPGLGPLHTEFDDKGTPIPRCSSRRNREVEAGHLGGAGPHARVLLDRST